jgi:hypothetical protein
LEPLLKVGTTCRGGPIVEDLSTAVARSRLGLQAVQDLQLSYDQIGWDINEDEFAKTRHILLHLVVAIGRLSHIAEQLEHLPGDKSASQLRTQESELTNCAADLLIHAAQLANLLGSDLADCFLSRLTSNAQRFAPDSNFAHLRELT